MKVKSGIKTWTMLSSLVLALVLVIWLQLRREPAGRRRRGVPLLHLQAKCLRATGANNAGSRFESGRKVKMPIGSSGVDQEKPARSCLVRREYSTSSRIR